MFSFTATDSPSGCCGFALAVGNVQSAHRNSNASPNLDCLKLCAPLAVFSL
jgi:hypothetical protein